MWLVEMHHVITMSDQELNPPTSDFFHYPTGKIPVGTSCDHCGRFNARYMTVSVIGLNAANQVLLIKRKRDPEAGAWAMPGGYVDWHETLAMTATREFKEETGMDLTNLRFSGIYDDIHRDKDGRQNVDHCYVGFVATDQSPQFNQDEVIEMQWFPLDALPNYLAFDHRQMLEDYRGRQSS